jgi:hypothetical protein
VYLHCLHKSQPSTDTSLMPPTTNHYPDKMFPLSLPLKHPSNCKSSLEPNNLLHPSKLPYLTKTNPHARLPNPSHSQDISLSLPALHPQCERCAPRIVAMRSGLSFRDDDVKSIEYRNSDRLRAWAMWFIFLAKVYNGIARWVGGSDVVNLLPSRICK